MTKRKRQLAKVLKLEIIPLLLEAGFHEAPAFHFYRLRGYLCDVVSFDLRSGEWMDVYAHINPLYHPDPLDVLLVGGSQRVEGSELLVTTEEEARATAQAIVTHLRETALPWFESIPDLSHYLPKISENVSKYYAILTLGLLDRHAECTALIEDRLAKLNRMKRGREGIEEMIELVEEFAVVLQEDRVSEFVDGIVANTLASANLKRTGEP